MNNPVLLVRAQAKGTALPFYATQDGGLSPYTPESGPLHRSRFRNLLRQFATEAEASGFIEEKGADKRFEVIGIEPASPELMASFQTMEEERRLSLQRMLPLVDRVMATFDFSRVQKAMEALDWKYAADDTSPSLEKLQATARDLLTAAVEDDAEAMGMCGGFKAWRFGEKLYLSFEVACAYAEEGRSQRV